jgi:hypothetical protein
MKRPFVSKMHVCEINLSTKVDETCWDLIPQPSVQQSIALTPGLRAIVFAWPGLVCDIEHMHNYQHTRL